MKRLLMVLACASSPSFAAERSYSLTDFDEVRVIGGHRVTISPARATSVKAKGTQAAIEALSVETQGRTLIVQTLTRTLSAYPEAPAGAATVTITLPLLKSVRVQGSGSLSAALMRAPQVDVALLGSGSIAIARIEADRATLKLSGAGRIEAAGKVKDLTADVKGAGELASEKLVSADLKLTAATSGRATLTAARSAMITATGPGEVIILGKPACTVTNNGTGMVTCGTD